MCNCSALFMQLWWINKNKNIFCTMKTYFIKPIGLVFVWISAKVTNFSWNESIFNFSKKKCHQNNCYKKNIDKTDVLKRIQPIKISRND